MRGGMPFLPSWALPEKMISMRRISMPAPIPQRAARTTGSSQAIERASYGSATFSA